MRNQEKLRQWYIDNRERNNKRGRDHYHKNKTHYKAYRDSHIKERQLAQQKRKLTFPWLSHLTDANTRCNNPKFIRYYRYGGRGIKCLLTKDEIRELYIRDKAHLLKTPSLDRIDNDGNYTFDNCRFIEKIKNTQLSHNKSVLQFDLKGNFIREWESEAQAVKTLKISSSNISRVLHGTRKKTGGFIWKFKE